MHTDKEIIELIKTTYPLKPNVEFVVRTEEKLIQKAIGINRSQDDSTIIKSLRWISIMHYCNVIGFLS